MAISIAVAERRARYIMCIISLLLVLIVLAFKTGLISSEHSYKGQAWYAQNSHNGFVVTSEYADETECKRNETSPSACRSGMALIEEARANATSIELN